MYNHICMCVDSFTAASPKTKFSRVFYKGKGVFKDIYPMDFSVTVRKHLLPPPCRGLSPYLQPSYFPRV